MLSVLLMTALAAPLETHAAVHTLPNGLVLLLEEDHRADQIALHLRYGVGAHDEKDGEHGCAHLFEHLMFEGSRNVPNNAFDEWLTAGGGWNNAYTSEDVTAYHMAFPSGALDLALFLESDRMGFLDAGLDAKNLENQQGVVLQERYQGHEEPHGRDWDALTRLVYPEGHPYHVAVIGTVADVKGFSIEAVRDFWQRHYRARNGVLALVGHFEAEAAKARVEHWFSDVPDPGPPGPRSKPVPPDSGVRHARLEDQVSDRTAYLAWPTVDWYHDDAYALEVLSWVLNNGHGTRLDDALYYDRPLTTSVSAWTSSGDVAGMFVIDVSSDKTPLKKLAAEVTKVLQGVVDRPPTAEELLRAQRSIRAGYEDQIEDPVSRSELLTECWSQYKDPNCVGKEITRYEAITSARVVEVAQRYLLSRAPHTLSVVPQGDKRALPGATDMEIP